MERLGREEAEESDGYLIDVKKESVELPALEKDGASLAEGAGRNGTGMPKFFPWELSEGTVKKLLSHLYMNDCVRDQIQEKNSSNTGHVFSHVSLMWALDHRTG